MTKRKRCKESTILAWRNTALWGQWMGQCHNVWDNVRLWPVPLYGLASLIVEVGTDGEGEW